MLLFFYLWNAINCVNFPSIYQRDTSVMYIHQKCHQNQESSCLFAKKFVFPRVCVYVNLMSVKTDENLRSMSMSQYYLSHWLVSLILRPLVETIKSKFVLLYGRYVCVCTVLCAMLDKNVVCKWIVHCFVINVCSRKEGISKIYDQSTQ